MKHGALDVYEAGKPVLPQGFDLLLRLVLRLVVPFNDLAILYAGNGGEWVPARDKASRFVVYAADRPCLACGAMEDNVTRHDYLSHGFSFLHSEGRGIGFRRRKLSIRPSLPAFELGFCFRCRENPRGMLKNTRRSQFR